MSSQEGRSHPKKRDARELLCFNFTHHPLRCLCGNCQRRRGTCTPYVGARRLAQHQVAPKRHQREEDKGRREGERGEPTGGQTATGGSANVRVATGCQGPSCRVRPACAHHGGASHAVAGPKRGRCSAPAGEATSADTPKTVPHPKAGSKFPKGEKPPGRKAALPAVAGCVRRGHPPCS